MTSVSAYPKGKKKKKDKPSGISEKVIRLLKIYHMIAQNRYPSIQGLAEDFAASRRTIQRYMEIIRLIESVDYDHERKGYRFTNTDRQKKLSLTRGELITLLTAGEAVSRLGGNLGSTFQGLLQRMTTISDPSKEKQKVPFLIKLPGPVMAKNIEEHFGTLSLCASECRSVELEYLAQNSKKITKRTVDPYGLVFNEGIWIMIGKCHLREEIRSFALDRIINVTEGNHHFLRDSDFDLEKYFEKSWGVVDGDKMEVTVRFKYDVADYILRKEKWHSSEKRKVLPNGDVELSFNISGFVEFKHWAYSWLPYVEFVNPGWLRKRVEQELTEAVKLHN